MRRQLCRFSCRPRASLSSKSHSRRCQMANRSHPRIRRRLRWLNRHPPRSSKQQPHPPKRPIRSRHDHDDAGNARRSLRPVPRSPSPKSRSRKSQATNRLLLTPTLTLQAQPLSATANPIVHLSPMPQSIGLIKRQAPFLPVNWP